MKKKKLLLAIVIIAFIAVGWMMSLKSATGAESREKQKELTDEADIYLKKELWVRAIPLYEEALHYETKNSTEIESRLLDAYMGYKDTDSYNALVEKRAADGTAKEQEYLTAAEIYIAERNLNAAMELIKKGMAQTGSEKLEEYYEANRYAYTVSITKFQNILPTADNTMMPAYGADGWHYVDENGHVKLEGPFETALRFNEDGYAVISMGGKYYTILENGDKYGMDETGVTDVFAVSGSHILAQYNGKYSYYNYDFENVATGHQYEEMTVNDCGVAAVKKDGKWGVITDGGETVVDFILDDVAVNSLEKAFVDGVAMVQSGGEWYLLNTEGEKLWETGFAEAKAPESIGYIAVGNGEKWGFADRDGNLVIDYQYDDALSFSDHLAAVRVGNVWNYISEKNSRVIEQGFDDANPFHNGIAQAHIVDGEALVTLEYTEE